ncbi:hypothetical protein NFI96_026839 [Prochilodus magdalenae]|nr:hypothetical protein NFI96_026839 [Prochilodus magdalenae]
MMDCDYCPPKPTVVVSGVVTKLEHPHTVPADGAVGVEVEGHQAFWTCDNKPFILVLTTVPPHTDSLVVPTKTQLGLGSHRNGLHARSPELYSRLPVVLTLLRFLKKADRFAAGSFQVVAKGDKDFTPAAAQVAHTKPVPAVQKLPPAHHINQHIHQPRK